MKSRVKVTTKIAPSREGKSLLRSSKNNEVACDLRSLDLSPKKIRTDHDKYGRNQGQSSAAISTGLEKEKKFTICCTISCVYLCPGFLTGVYNHKISIEV